MRGGPAFFALLFLAAPAVGQVLPPPQLALGDLHCDSAGVAVAPAKSTCSQAWTLTADPAASADGKATIEWGLACRNVTAEAPASPVPFQPGASVHGNATFTLSADPTARALRPIPCVLRWTLVSTAEGRSSGPDLGFTVTAAYVPGFKVDNEAPRQTAGPQKVIRYPIGITNTGNARTQFVFSFVSKPHGTWSAILPEAVVLDPGQNHTSTFTVATPFHQLYNRDSGDYALRVTASAVDDPGQAGGSQDVQVHADSHGMYVPGPGLASALAAVASAAFARRRQRR